MKPVKNLIKAMLLLLIVTVIIIVGYFVSWMIVTGIIWFLFKIFHISFSIIFATILWLALVVWKWIPKKKGDSNANV